MLRGYIIEAEFAVDKNSCTSLVSLFTLFDVLDTKHQRLLNITYSKVLFYGLQTMVKTETLLRENYVNWLQLCCKKYDSPDMEMRYELICHSNNRCFTGFSVAGSQHQIYQINPVINHFFSRKNYLGTPHC